MPTYSRETHLDIDEATAYAYLSDVTNLPTYFPQMTSARPTSGDEVETSAVVEQPGQEPRTEHGTAWFKADDSAKKVSWGSEGTNDYHGELDFDDDGESACTVRLSLHTEHDYPGIEDSIDETLQSIKSRLLEDQRG